MNSILYVIHDTIYPAIDGGKKIVLGRVFNSKSEGKLVVVVLFNYNRADTSVMRPFFKENDIKFYEYTPKLNFLGRASFFHLLLSPFPFYERKIARCEKEFSSLLYRVISDEQPDHISFESVFFYSVLRDVRPNYQGSLGVLFHNHESTFFRELAKASFSKTMKMFFWIEAYKVRYLEYKIFRESEIYDLLLTFLTEEDLRRYVNTDGFKPVSYTINHNKLFVAKVIHRELDRENKFFLFPGSLNFPFNMEGVLWLADEYENSSLECKIVITGSARPEYLKALSAYTKLEFAGHVDESELYRLYSTCVAVISPIISGSGVKVKNLESVQLGLPTIMTKFSATGISAGADSAYIANAGVEGFVAAMQQVLKDTSSRR